MQKRINGDLYEVVLIGDDSGSGSTPPAATIGPNVPASGTGSIVEASYSRLRAALDRVRGGSGYAKFGFVGDSTEAGAWSGGVAGVAGLRPISPTVFRTAALNSVNLPAVADNFVGDQSWFITNPPGTAFDYDARLSQPDGAAWVFPATRAAGGSVFNNSTNANRLGFLPNNPVDTFEITYPTNTTLGSFQVTRTGDASSAVISQAGASGIAKLTFSGALGNTNPVFIARQAGGAYIAAIDAYNSHIKSVRCFNIGWSGGKTSDWIDSSTGFAPLPSLVAMACDLYLIRPGINEWNNAVPVATFQANLDTLVSALLAVGDVALATPYPSQNSSFTLGVQKPYVDAIYAIAAKYKLAINDTWQKVASWEQANAFGYYGNNLHPKSVLYKLAAESDVNFLLSL